MKKSDKQTAEGFLYTDMYQLTMAQLYFRMGIHEKTAQFDHFFRKNPDYGSHKAGYCVNAGLEWLLDWMSETRCTRADVDHLAGQKSRDGGQLFHDDFLKWLRENGSFDCLKVTSIPEGRVVHPNIPLNVVQGPLAIAQILESPLLNHLNYQTLIATKASRLVMSGRGQPVVEFGMRRAQGYGANAGVRGALVGGAVSSSNTGVSHVLGVDPKGTHAHSMVQAFMAMGEGEIGAFQAYADVYPDDCILLVDTIDTLQSGIPNAIRVFEKLRRNGHQPVAVRLDSGDLAYLAVRSAKMLNEAGFSEVKIVLSNQLDEIVISQIIAQIAEDAPKEGVDPDALVKRLMYGVGTRFITSKGQAALDGVYKLVALQDDGDWTPAIKVSETAAKTLNPGHKKVWRVYDRRGNATADLLSLDDENPEGMDPLVLRHPTEEMTRRELTPDDISGVEPLMMTAYERGRRFVEDETLEEIRQRRTDDVERLDSGVRRLVNPHVYHVSLTEKLWQLKQDLIQHWKAQKPGQDELFDE